jgi:hypothetical protein
MLTFAQYLMERVSGLTLKNHQSINLGHDTFELTHDELGVIGTVHVTADGPVSAAPVPKRGEWWNHNVIKALTNSGPQYDMGVGEVKRLLGSIRGFYPRAKSIDTKRDTGVNPGRKVHIAL